jgi:CRISPR/Cas system-associated endoribonuclease Cas2
MKILFKNQYSIFATRISWADFNNIKRKFKNSGEPYLDQLFLIKRDASKANENDSDPNADTNSGAWKVLEAKKLLKKHS